VWVVEEEAECDSFGDVFIFFLVTHEFNIAEQGDLNKLALLYKLFLNSMQKGTLGFIIVIIPELESNDALHLVLDLDSLEDDGQRSVYEPIIRNICWRFK
jgi:hypothetical protein